MVWEMARDMAGLGVLVSMVVIAQAAGFVFG